MYPQLNYCILFSPEQCTQLSVKYMCHCILIYISYPLSLIKVRCVKMYARELDTKL